MLAEAGVTTLAELQQLGAVRAYRLVSQLQHGKASLNLLWALAAGLEDRDWRSLSRDERDSLRRELRGWIRGERWKLALHRLRYRFMDSASPGEAAAPPRRA